MISTGNHQLSLLTKEVEWSTSVQKISWKQLGHVRCGTSEIRPLRTGYGCSSQSNQRNPLTDEEQRRLKSFASILFSMVWTLFFFTPINDQTSGFRSFKHLDLHEYSQERGKNQCSEADFYRSVVKRKSEVGRENCLFPHIRNRRTGGLFRDCWPSTWALNKW